MQKTAQAPGVASPPTAVTLRCVCCAIQPYFFRASKGNVADNPDVDTDKDWAVDSPPDLPAAGAAAGPAGGGQRRRELPDKSSRDLPAADMAVVASQWLPAAPAGAAEQSPPALPAAEAAAGARRRGPAVAE